MASDVMASIYIEHEFPTHSMRHTPVDEDDRESSCELLDQSGHDDATDTVPALSDSPGKPRPRRPEVPRCSTDPTSASSLQNTSTHMSARRNRSPYSKGHLRARPTSVSLSAPGMTRAHSWGGNPAAQTTEINTTPSNTLRVPGRTRSPYRSSEDASLHNTPQKMWYDVHGGSAIESIQEDSELDLTPRGHQGPLSLAIHTLPRSSSLRRRPASPLHALGNATPSHTVLASFPADPASISSGANHSPSLGAQRFNEAYPSLHHYASSSSFSSISSTPTSARSRSPSISSLETIEDVPDLESEALETERIERFKLAAERAENGENGEDTEDGLRRRSLDTPRATGFGFSRGGSSRERKRWSVCGGERRADLDLETIWED